MVAVKKKKEQRKGYVITKVEFERDHMLAGSLRQAMVVMLKTSEDRNKFAW